MNSQNYMKIENYVKPDYLFEVSWEVCNKVGGIHTVISTKALELSKELKGNHIFIGPDLWREIGDTAEFKEDLSLFRSWRRFAAEEGLRVKIGRWSIPSEPIAILIDYSVPKAHKDEILTDLWKKFGLDSLTGQWDYIESLLFGYQAAKVIESFVTFNLSPRNKIAAHFHEWQTGAGILYIKDKKLPLATLFTTHATTLGRSIAGNNRPLYDLIDCINPDETAKELNIQARHSLEKCSAINCDIFTTVSDLTAHECKMFLGREPDIVTPNGFDNSIVPDSNSFKRERKLARERLIEVASLMSGTDYAEDVLITAISGRYEFKNKGIDLFIDSLELLKRRDDLSKKVIAFIMVPSGHSGPDQDLLLKREIKGSEYTTNVSHILNNPGHDAIVRRVNELQMINRREDSVHLFFIPSYLNGDDGVFNMKYYDLLLGMDLTVFPSYYEPWGYTPLESLAFKVPTITTSLAGFGLWIEDHFENLHPSAIVLKRDDHNYERLKEEIAKAIYDFCTLEENKRIEYSDNAAEVSTIALWKNNIDYYRMAYSKAINKILDNYIPDIREEEKLTYMKIETNRPSWSRVLISRQIPERLKHLETISNNLWWCWNQQAVELYKSINEKLWDQVYGNPIALLDKISYKQYKELEKDTEFLGRLDRVYADFSEYMEQKSNKKGDSIAYFSMEYGLDTSLKIYSGGLGILAGDYLKESSDMNVKMTAVGLLYRYGYFNQQLTSQGDQVSEYQPQDFTNIPATPVRDENDNWITVNLAFHGRNVYARLWRVDVGRTELYLLDTDYEDNLPEDQSITHHLYGGSWENRLKQELLLGVGGIRALRALGINADVYHCNEGHAAFTSVERLREYIQNDNLLYQEALEVVRSSSLFTTHTPVPAGHDAFDEDLLKVYISHYPERLKISWRTFMGLGKINPDNHEEKFSMSNLACNLSQEINGVSWLHGKVSQEILSDLWPGYLPEELHVGYVTNGVHYPTWTAPEWKEIHSKVFGDKFASHNYDKHVFEGIYKVNNQDIWSVRSLLRKRLIDCINERLSNTEMTKHYSPHEIVKIKDTLRSDVLTIGFARRFATYKRAHLLFRDLDRLSEIINNSERPVQFIFAGKAHPADKAGQDLIKRIVEISKLPQFIGKIVFISNYDMTLGKLLTQGVDIWMNTPTRPLEASGTSGEKAVMNGVMHFSVLDGWWVEGYKEGAGWALKMERTYDDQQFQDELDAATIYNLLEDEITPIFYDLQEGEKIPGRWIDHIKNTVAKVACDFTTNRMFNDYIEKYYAPLAKRSRLLCEDNYREAIELAQWKVDMRREWPEIEIVNFSKPDNSKESLVTGREYMAEIDINLGNINPNDIGVEIVFADQDKKGKYHIRTIYPFEYVSMKDGVAHYSCKIIPDSSGVYQIAGRMFACNKLLANRQDFELVKWL